MLHLCIAIACCPCLQPVLSEACMHVCPRALNLNPDAQAVCCRARQLQLGRHRAAHRARERSSIPSIIRLSCTSFLPSFLPSLASSLCCLCLSLSLVSIFVRCHSCDLSNPAPLPPRRRWRRRVTCTWHLAASSQPAPPSTFSPLSCSAQHNIDHTYTLTTDTGKTRKRCRPL